MKPRHTLLFVAIVIALLALISVVFPTNGVKIAGKELHFASLNSILSPQPKINLDSLLAAQEAELQELNSIHDSILFYQHSIDSSDIRFWFPQDDPTFFDSFFQQAESAQTTQRIIRILHYGDSQIEMDRLSCRLRSYMQTQFGGGGPGMLPIQTIIPSFAISQYAQGNLALRTCFGDSIELRANGNYGPMVQCFRLEGSSFTDYKASQRSATDARCKTFSSIKLLYNNRPGPLTATLIDRQHDTTQTQTSDSSQVGIMKWQLPSASNSVRLKLDGTADIYGVMLDNGPGVSVDNIPMRGCSGQQFTMINSQQLTSAYALMDVGIIIMQFGGNSVPYLHPGKSLETYCKSIGNQIDRIHQCCPKALVLFIGPSDMSTTISGQLQTYPYMETIIDSLQHTATRHGAAYWSIYHAMGGHNSMLAWVDKGWAGTDYIHFSPKGADIMGDRLADAFDKLYAYYRLRHNLSSSQQQKLDSIYEE